jgi:hypothetical protein
VKNARQRASKWRIELARDLTERYYAPREHVKMIVLGGSPSKGLSDSYSDLDIVVYWDRVDIPWLEAIPLKDLNCERELFKRMGDADIYLESYYFGNLKVDFGHVTLDVWKQLTDEVIDRLDPDPDKHGTIGGFLDAVPLYGRDLFEKWSGRLRKWPEGLAQNVVKRHLRFYHRGVLLHQGLERGDLVYFYDGICRMLKNLLGVLAGLNHVYYSPEEPRWVEYYLTQMSVKPRDMVARINSIFDADRPQATEILEELIDDVFDLIAEHMTEIDASLPRHRYNLVVRPTDSAPKIA